MIAWKEYFGELVGTFILVFIGCGSVAVAVLLEGFSSLLEVAIVWGVGVAIAIFAVRNICPAHLNPAVSFAMFLSKEISIKKFAYYSVSQLFGAFLAGGFLYLVFQNSIVDFEVSNGIIRGEKNSYHSAMMFGEFFPNPGYENRYNVSHLLACTLEAAGTFILVFVIFKLTQSEKKIDNLIPILIGLTVTIIICLIAPFTQAGINPARDLGPRIVAAIAGWGHAAFPSVKLSFLSVYVLSPLVGGGAGYLANRLTKRKK